VRSLRLNWRLTKQSTLIWDLDANVASTLIGAYKSNLCRWIYQVVTEISCGRHLLIERRQGFFCFNSISSI